jgi:ribosomal-protein-alanine N-acetyltransferase
MTERYKFPRLETERLILRQMTMDDLDFYFKHFSVKEIEDGSGFPAPKDIDTAKEEMQRFIIGLFEKNLGFRWGIAKKGEVELVGTCGYYDWNKEARKAQIGYDLEPACWGQGIMTEALMEMLRFGFEEMDLNRIQVMVAPRNERSTRLVLRLGFKKEGVLRDNFVFKGKLQDDVMFSLLRREWDERRGRIAGKR